MMNLFYFVRTRKKLDMIISDIQSARSDTGKHTPVCSEMYYTCTK